ncbi:MAG: ATP-binding cassette domain-containing protein [Christensenellaceae bacterium]|nr:ATP-binding cassette domain-containing protein [Christensenellaceae bacterium]
MIEISHLCKSYGKKRAVHDVSFSIAPGEVVGLIGKNGAGKSTILKSIAGLLRYESGEIRACGKDIRQCPDVIGTFGILLECAFLDYLNAYENLRLLYCANLNEIPKDVDEKLNAAFELVGLGAVKHKRVKSYSFGMKQRLGLAQAIITAQTFMMLDEPFIGLDPVGKEIAKKAILTKAKDEQQAVLFSSHDLDDVADICDKIVMIDQGQCVYNDRIHKIHQYAILLGTRTDISMINRSLAALDIPYDLVDRTVSFTDQDEAPRIHDVLAAILPHGTVEIIDSIDNILASMFKEGAKNDSIISN